ncbi:hypothetical protein DCAR_0205728 [Daucus carota subsp. sativus]|uniref:Uncharacterized protein n=1 Tax=Daucus carota subsp. sativus TaxID=79200 RepID=A0A175YCJ7_DAUCS|nr:hypothetical protein DCAR_0205728 [Daucus carota subsp. sativus]
MESRMNIYVQHHGELNYDTINSYNGEEENFDERDAYSEGDDEKNDSYQNSEFKESDFDSQDIWSECDSSEDENMKTGYVGPLEDITNEAETGKFYRAYYSDKLGRSIIVMKPGYEVLLNLADSRLQEQRMVKE